MLILDNTIPVRMSTDSQHVYNSLSLNCFTVYLVSMLSFYSFKIFSKKIKKIKNKMKKN